MKALPPSLYQITSDLAELETALENDLTPATDPAIMGTLVEAIRTKTDSVVGFVQYMEDQTAAIDSRIKELSAYKASINGKLDRLDQYVASCLKLLNTSKVEGVISTISRRAPTDVVVITNEGELPMEFLQTTVAPKKVDIKAAIKAGKVVPGAIIEKSQNISMTYKNKKALSRKEAAAEEVAE